MRTRLDQRSIKLLLVTAVALLLASCHSKYLNLEIKSDGTMTWNKNHTAFAFIANNRLYRKPIGIARFPDGGTTKNEYMDFSLYIFNIKHNKLTHLISLNEFYLKNAYRWLSIKQIDLSLQDSLLFYKLRPPYDNDIKYIEKDKRADFLNKISKTYYIDIYTLKKGVTDSDKYRHLFKNGREKLNTDIRNKYLANIPYNDWGINIKKIYPQSKRTYMDYIIEGTGITNVILEQIAPEFTEEDKNHIIEEMTKKKKLLLKEWNKLDRDDDPYRSSKRKEKYIRYIKYIEKVKTSLNIPSTIDPQKEQKEVFKSLQIHGIKIPDNFKTDDLIIHDQGYDIKFKLTDATPENIDKYKKWFRSKVIYLLNHQWEPDKQTRYEKPDSDGIVRNDMVHFISEHTTLQHVSTTHKQILHMTINYSKGTNRNKSFTFNVSEEHTPSR